MSPADGVGEVLRVTDVGVRFHNAQRDLPSHATLRIAPGELVLLLGPSGCGKSSLSLTFNGLVPHSVPAGYRGQVMVCDLDVAATPVAELARRVGMVFQDPDAQIVSTSVLDEVCFGLENLCTPVDLIEPRARDALGRVGLEHLENADPHLMSGGEKQRVALACALALEPALLLLDEPTANLDPAGRAAFYDLLPDLLAAGTAAVLIEHELDDVIDKVDRVVVFSAAGDTIVAGTPEEVMEVHGDVMVAEGVWLPTAVRLHRALAASGKAGSSLPLTRADLRPEGYGARLGRLGVTPPVPRPTERVPETTGVEVVDLVVERDRRRIIDGMSFRAPGGAITALVGVNGAGKSTVLHAIAGLLPSSGTIVIPTGRTAVRPGYVFQNPEHQFLTDRVSDELAFGPRRLGWPKERVRSAVEDQLARFGLTDLADRNPFLLSGGQKRRLSVASALITQPPLLLLDEPTYGQDHRNATEMMRLLQELSNDGTTVLLVSHDLQLVAEHAERVVVLHGGRAAVAGTAHEVLGNPRVVASAGLRLPPMARIAARAAQEVTGWTGLLRERDLDCPSTDGSDPR
ncbi:ABC transporter ATP-binding protein [Tsukamurella sp. 8F]|uniref:ABC transporter ATP-binding protein n=1 Tax=unclassified Tsukamurella TaxID=2633480 RepID=UPI0023B9A41F|nr:MULTISPECIES: ABC transporter ATP-binding protein [unclassified Tsukamurella]MDF0532391.1 ABC transporter ATP-binding protein [Tsukamurella sp. 8J]MDF0588623.1 ABC transporter ATP-binding protein [Tsukamurella sp. 8F]